ncbi:MAG: type I restriction endonuclease subunit R [bacterium]|nr:type I restriction endonuclease subunit R [bacterium]
MPHQTECNEENISQIPALELLKRLGYIYLSPDEAEAQRGSLYNVLLRSVLEEQLDTLNSYDYKGTNYCFSDKNIAQAIQDLDEPLGDGLLKINEKVFDRLALGESYSETLPDGAKRSFTLKYIDWETPDNNVFHVTDEFTVERTDGRGTYRPDLVLFVNGIPFGVIECKRASVSVNEGISQMLRNQGKNAIPQLFKFTQIVLSTNRYESKYATCSTSKEFWSVWKEEDESWQRGILQDCLPERAPIEQDKTLASLFHPTRVLELIRFFTLFEKNIKKIARYQQYFAVKEILRRVEITDTQGNRQSGVIWHTQGSGKSLTMVMLAKYLFHRFADRHPKIVLVTDRKNLDKQIHRTFNHARLRAGKANSGRHLVELIDSDSADVVTTLVHKFDKASELIAEPVTSQDVFVLVDESHRTHYGELHIKMKQVFPNACYLAFTGTPLMKREKKSTMMKFGKQLFHKYTIADGVADKTIVPLLYEGKMVEQTVNKNAIDRRLEMITRQLNDTQKAEVKRKWSQFEKIASSEQRISLIAFDINEHFLTNYKTSGSQFKAMLATNSKSEAIAYREVFEELGDLNVAVVISPPDQREGYTAVDQQSQDRIKQFWDAMMLQYRDEEEYEECLKNEFIEGDGLDLLIVVDKLLTGFDAPRATVLYVDKPMKEHTLLQAIARVNRLFEGKDYGRIIDYRGLLQKLDDALKLYSGAGLENFDPEDLKNVFYDVISIVGTLRQYCSDLKGIFAFVTARNSEERLDQCGALLADDELREEFYDALSGFGRHLAIALESEEVYQALREGELPEYKREVKFYQELRKVVKLRYSDGIDHKEYEAKMQKLMDNYITAEEMTRITKPVDILDRKGFEEELQRLGSPRAKADAIRTRMSKSINAKWDENPAYYKKFSRRIEETIEAYKAQRISEAEYFEQMQQIHQDYASGEAGQAHSYPDAIRDNGHAKAFYGNLKSLIKEDTGAYLTDSDVAEIALGIDRIFGTHVKVDWRDNLDVHNKIEQDIDDLLYDELFDKHSLDADSKEIEKIIEELKTIALRRY